jgi:hypothetical protein
MIRGSRMRRARSWCEPPWIEEGRLRDPNSYDPPSNVKSWAIDTLSRFDILSRVSNDGALIPRSIKLRKSTEMSIASAKRS